MNVWIALHYWGAKLWPSRPKRAVDPLPPMPTDEPARTAQTVRRALPDLIRLNRYESRAIARRDRAIRGLLAQKE